MAPTHWGAGEHHATSTVKPVIPHSSLDSYDTRYSVLPGPARAPTPQGSYPHHQTLRRSTRLTTSQYSTSSLMQRSQGDGAPQNQYRPGQQMNSNEQPSSRQIPNNEWSASHQGQPKRPPSRDHHYGQQESYPNVRPGSQLSQHPRTDSRLSQYPRPDSQLSQYAQPESQQHLYLRRESRRPQYEGSATRHAQSSRPGSSQDHYPRQEASHAARPSSRSSVRPPSRPPSRLDGADPGSHQSSNRQHSRHNDAEGRAFRKGIADTTIAAINSGIEGVDWGKTQRNTKLYHENDRDLCNWKRPPRSLYGPPTTMEVNIVPLSTLKASRYLFDTLQNPGKIGVLNFASATLPGGGFLTGARAQEESIARSSTLYVALTTPAARPFYATHAADDRKGFYTHSMIYSPDVHLFRDDNGEWLPPLAVDVLTSPAVNAGQVRRQVRGTSEAQIQDVMHERMGRILALFERKKVRNLVLGSFGTGVFQNDVRAMASIWYGLLQAPGARFAGSFDRVLFAIPDDLTAKQFNAGFRGRHSKNE